MLGRSNQRDSGELVVLSLLAEGPKYGYLLTKQAAALSQGQLRLTPGVLYPLLKALEQQRLVTSSWEEVKAEDAAADEPGRRRKWYTITKSGVQRLEQRVDAHRLAQRFIDRILSVRDGQFGGVRADQPGATGSGEVHA